MFSNWVGTFTVTISPQRSYCTLLPSTPPIQLSYCEECEPLYMRGNSMFCAYLYSSLVRTTK